VPQSGSNGTAKRLRGRTESAPDKVVMLTLVCYQCGAQFAIAHRSSCPDQALAARQAIWLANNFVWDHFQENNHKNSIQLPGSSEMK